MASQLSVRVGGVEIGGGAPVVVQSMTLTKTHDVPATTAQIAALAGAGCAVVRVAVPKLEDAEALPKIIRFSPIPVIADIHFNASLALKAIEAGVAAVRINPGNIGGPDKVEQVVKAAKKQNTPMRIGANSGSLPKHLYDLAQEDQAKALLEAALEEVRLLERLDYRNFKISVKSSHVPTMIRAYRMLSEKVPYPLHLGVTDAATPGEGRNTPPGVPAALRGRGARLRRERTGGGRRRGFRDRRWTRRRLHLRTRPRSQEGVFGHPRRRALPRDRHLDRGRDAPPERLKMAKPAALAMAEASLIPLGT